MAPEAQVGAALLRQGRRLDGLSSALLLLCAALGLGQALARPADAGFILICLGLVLFGLLQKYWALRVAFDAALFERLGGLSLSELDDALLGLGLLPADKAGRPLAPRLRGALRLLRLQALALVLQLLVLLGGLIDSLWSSLSA